MFIGSLWHTKKAVNLIDTRKDSLSPEPKPLFFGGGGVYINVALILYYFFIVLLFFI